MESYPFAELGGLTLPHWRARLLQELHGVTLGDEPSTLLRQMLVETFVSFGAALRAFEEDLPGDVLPEDPEHDAAYSQLWAEALLHNGVIGGACDVVRRLLITARAIREGTAVDRIDAAALHEAFSLLDEALREGRITIPGEIATELQMHGVCVAA